MTQSILDYLLTPKKTCSTAPKGYKWIVIQDLIRSAEKPGLFYGRLFRLIDIHLERDEHSIWPNGIVLQYINTQDRLANQCELLIDIDNARVFHKSKRK